MSCTAQRNSDPETRREIKELLQEVRDEYQIEGMSLAFINPDSGSLLVNNGFSNKDHEFEINDSTLFSAQSLSKTFTSLACLVAVSEGLLDLDTPIENYLSDFRVNSIHEENAGAKISLRHLLSHTSALPADAPVGNIFNPEFQASVYAPLADRIASIDQVWLRTKVGAQYYYSNLGFDLVARIIEKVSGQSFADYTRQKVLLPLGMNHSSFNLISIPKLNNTAQGECSNSNSQVPVLFASLGGGGLYTCTKDMAAFLSSAIKGFPKILDKDLIQEFNSIPFSKEKSGYALGQTLSYIQYCTTSHGHTGNGYGFTSSMLWLPEYNVGIAILCNRESVYPGLQRIQSNILKTYLQTRKAPMDCHNLSQYPNEIIESDLEYYRGLSGNYSNGNINLRFETRGKQFGVLSPADGSFHAFHFQSKNQWLLEDQEIILFTYRNGEITNSNNGMSFQKLGANNPKAMKPNPRLEQYVGRYRSYAYGILESIEVIDIWEGQLRLNGSPLKEHEEGLFFDPFGQIVDFRNGKVQIEYGEYEKID